MREFAEARMVQGKESSENGRRKGNKAEMFPLRVPVKKKRQTLQMKYLGDSRGRPSTTKKSRRGWEGSAKYTIVTPLVRLLFMQKKRHREKDNSLLELVPISHEEGPTPGR